MKLHLTVLFSLVALTSAFAAEPRPNIGLIYADDLGYGDVGAYGSKLIPTTPGERKNLATQEPDKVKELQAQLDQLRSAGRTRR